MNNGTTRHDINIYCYVSCWFFVSYFMYGALNEGAKMTPKEVKDIRLDLGLTQKAFAESLGYKTNTISAWEQGVRNINNGAIAAINKMTEFRGHLVSICNDIIKGESDE